ncbi:MAG: protein-export chaperone SecB [Rickettsiales bacterium]|nr:protein-export chaperone SecB [Rickettsiales bacterium]
MATNENQNQQAERQISVIVQYVKDISFENPNSPNSLQPSNERPNINVSVDVMAKKLEGENNFEVELKIGVNAKRNEEILFIAEVNYAGIFLLKNIPDNEFQPALLIYCPNLLFPFVRRIVSDLTRDAGFPTLMLDPIDFGKLYMQRMEQLQKEQQAQ